MTGGAVSPIAIALPSEHVRLICQ